MNDAKKYWEITEESISLLEESAAWKQSGFFERYGFTPTNVYGARGTLSCFYGITWNAAESMKSNLCQNMGGGVPIEVIDELVRISETQ